MCRRASRAAWPSESGFRSVFFPAAYFLLETLLKIFIAGIRDVVSAFAFEPDKALLGKRRPVRGLKPVAPAHMTAGSLDRVEFGLRHVPASFARVRRRITQNLIPRLASAVTSDLSGTGILSCSQRVYDPLSERLKSDPRAYL